MLVGGIGQGNTGELSEHLGGIAITSPGAITAPRSAAKPSEIFRESLNTNGFCPTDGIRYEHMFDQEFDTIPANVGDLQPGPELGGVLACVEVDRVSPYDRVIVLQAHYRQVGYHNAESYRAMTAIVEAMGIEDYRSVAESGAAEISAALHLTRRATDRELAFALDLQQRLPRVWSVLAEGLIDVWRAKVLADRTVHLSEPAARWVVGRVIDRAPTLTSGELRARVDRLAMEADPGAAKERYEAAVGDRGVVAEATSDGTGNLLGLDLPPHSVAAASRHINRLARELSTAAEGRTMDQLRADIFVDLLRGKITTGDAGVVHLSADLDTLSALAEHPGELNGYGPVVSDIARLVAEELDDAEWRYLVTDTATGRPLAAGVTNRRPTVGQRRHIETRRPACVFPGCRMPSVDCDIDHSVAWIDGGPTTNCNLAPLCRHHHRIKHDAGWSYCAIGDTDYLWTTRLGHLYTTSGLPP